MKFAGSATIFLLVLAFSGDSSGQQLDDYCPALTTGEMESAEFGLEKLLSMHSLAEWRQDLNITGASTSEARLLVGISNSNLCKSLSRALPHTSEDGGAMRAYYKIRNSYIVIPLSRSIGVKLLVFGFRDEVSPESAHLAIY